MNKPAKPIEISIPQPETKIPKKEDMPRQMKSTVEVVQEKTEQVNQ